MSKRLIALRLIVPIILVLSALGVLAPATLAAGVCPKTDGDLRPLVSAGGTISLSCPSDTTIDLLSTITISNTVTLDASSSPGAITLDGGNTTSLLSVQSGGNLTVDQLTFTRGSHFDGGAIANSGGTVTITASTFLGNGNSGLSGGALYNGAGTMSVAASSFSQNSGWDGAAISNGGVLHVTDSSFTGNFAFANGTINNSGDGEATVDDSTFSGNHATNGGAIALSGGSLTVDGSTFDTNVTDNGNAGAIYASGGTLTISNSTFSSNSASALGGALYNQATLDISNSTFTGNTALLGGAIGADAALTVSGSVFSANSGGTGGAIYSRATLSITTSSFTNNSTDSNNGGGAIFLSAQADNDGSHLDISDSSFVRNSSGYGGAIQIGGTALSTITGSTFAQNSGSVGGVFFLGIDSPVDVSNSTFYKNGAQTGGVFYTEAAEHTITSSTFFGNTAAAGSMLYAAAGGQLLTAGADIFLGSSGTNCAFVSTYRDLGFNLQSDTSCTGGADDGIGGSANLGPLADNDGPTATMALLSDSAAIDQIPASYIPSGATAPLCPSTDQRGYARPDDSEAACDIGAYESGVGSAQPNISTTTSLAAAINPSVVGQPVTFTATVSPAPEAGTVTFQDNGEAIGVCTAQAVDTTAGSATCTAALAGAGTHHITASYNGVTPYASSDAATALSQTVNPASTTTSLQSSSNTVLLGRSISFTATVSAVAPGAGIPTGTVIFFDDGNQFASGQLNANGEVGVSTSALAAGSHAITATYQGDDDFSPSVSTSLPVTVDSSLDSALAVQNVTITYGPTSVLLSASVTSAETVNQGTISFSVTSADGSQTLCTSQATTVDGNGAVSNVSCGFGSPPSVGSYIIQASYHDAVGAFANSTGSGSLTVGIASSAISIANLPANAVYGGSFTPSYSRTGDGTPSTSSLTTDTCTVALGVVSFVGVGQCRLQASISAGTNYDAATGSVQSFTINPAPATITLSNLTVNYTGNPQAPTVTTDPPGLSVSLDYSLNGEPVSNPTDVGFYTVTVTITDPHYSGKTSDVFIIQTPVILTPTTTTVVSSDNPSVTGELVYYTATVSPVPDGGTVAFLDNNSAISNCTAQPVEWPTGKATCAVLYFSPGSHSITATFGSYGAFAGSTSSELDQVVNQASTTPPVITPTVSGTLGNNGWYTSDVTVSWTVDGGQSGMNGPDGCEATTITADTTSTTLTCTAANAGGSNSVSVTIKRDATAPALTPSVSPNPVLLHGAATASPNAGDDTSGVASSSCDAVDTSSVGAHSVGCSATDVAGNTASASAGYTVTYQFSDFASPLDSSLLNLAKAGQTVPLKWRLTDANGNPVTTLSSVSVSAVSLQCSIGTTADLTQESASGGSGLQNLGNGYYQFNWSTPKSYAGSCKTLRLNLGEGSASNPIYHTADFKFVK